jgi:type III restriction enzyme
MTGRVLRQPQAMRTGIEVLDEAHVLCADVDVGEAVAHIKHGLEAKGMGDLAGEIKISNGGGETTEIEAHFREKFRGKRIMVPRVLHRDGKRKYRELDYDADVLARVDFERLSWREAESFNLAAYDVGKQEGFTVDLAAGGEFALQARAAAETIIDSPLDRSSLIRRMLDVVPNPWQGARILDEALAQTRERGGDHRGPADTC